MEECKKKSKQTVESDGSHDECQGKINTICFTEIRCNKDRERKKTVCWEGDSEKEKVEKKAKKEEEKSEKKMI